ncbi:MAG: hypothetical protein HFJ06_03030 [Lachnospiraceae bacterium]|nr:hypothetical protein [Lachnospiraceae bacterium]
MGGIGSGRKPKSKATVKSRKKKAKKEIQTEGRLYSVPAHVRSIRTSGACRFEG